MVVNRLAMSSLWPSTKLAPRLGRPARGGRPVRSSRRRRLEPAEACRSGGASAAERDEPFLASPMSSPARAALAQPTTRLRGFTRSPRNVLLDVSRPRWIDARLAISPFNPRLSANVTYDDNADAVDMRGAMIRPAAIILEDRCARNRCSNVTAWVLRSMWRAIPDWAVMTVTRSCSTGLPAWMDGWIFRRVARSLLQ